MVGVAVLEVGVQEVPCRPRSRPGVKATFEMPTTAVETARVINKKQSQYIVDVWGRTRGLDDWSESKAVGEDRIYMWQLL